MLPPFCQLIHLLWFISTLVTWISAYESKYDSIGPDAIINNKRLYQKYFECVAREGRCTPDAKFIKGIIAEALPTVCSKCNTRQKIFADTLVAFMLTSKPEDYEELEKKYDPTGIFRKDLQKRMASS